ncbi:cilia- and flagella-associated protein 69 [Xylocopa sonorina]|uniref:cilia- and flagella-associated protein 69 n=1 Tax=Xylocopa sonorina TaxID=1818115 RepID=UPI00403A8865
MEQRKLMETILQMINPSTVETKISWNVSQFWDLWLHAMNVLSILAPKMPKEFMKYDGSTRLYMLLEWCLDVNINVEVITTCTKTICIIILSDNIYLLECFREYGIILLLIKLINNILKWNKMTMRVQRLLTLALISTEKLMEKQTFYQEIYGDHSITFTMELLFQCLYQKDQEYQIDQRLLLAIGSYIWKCIVWNFKSLEKFVQYGAIYIILDIIEIAPYYSRCLFLAILTDMCDNFFCGPFLCTWRGIDKRTGLMSLLANIWREEEIRLKVKRNVDGTVKDEELPQMGNKQWLDTYHRKLDKGSSPAITDMIGSVRSKIYSICKIIERDNERYKMAKEHYKILHANLSVEDRITISVIELYFALKLGQVWIEVSKYFEQVGITPLGMDGQALFLMTQRYYLLGSLAKERQNRIIQSIEKEEEIEEKDEYARIRDAKLVLALDAFDELEYIHRTTDRSYMLKKKYEQIQQVNSALKFPQDSDAANCYRTFQDKPMVTAIFNQYQIISSDIKPNSHLSYTKLEPVSISSSDSSISDERYSILSVASLSSTCFPRMEEFDKNE